MCSAWLPKTISIQVHQLPFLIIWEVICHFHTRAIARWRKARCFVYAWVEYYLWANKIGTHCTCSLRRQPTLIFKMPPLVSPAKMTSEKWAQKLHTDDVTLPRFVISVEFLCSFLRHHLIGKPLVALRNIICFLRLLHKRRPLFVPIVISR